MSQLAVNLILALNDLVPVTPTHRELARAKESISSYQRWEYEEIKIICRDFEPLWDLKGKLLLDVGCGLGGKLLFYAEEGAKNIIGIDIRPKSVQATAELAQAQESSIGSRIHPVLADGEYLPFPSDSFDVVTCVNVLEHVTNPGSLLSECKRVLRPGGRFFLFFPPFYSPWGPHLDGWINFPWPHLFFSERDLVKAAAQVEASKGLNDRYIPSAQVRWSEFDRLPDLNRLTIRQFRALVAMHEFKVLQLRLLPFGRHFLQKSALHKLLLPLLRVAAFAPLLNEVIVTKIAATLSK
jgi:SAM-dependent methyltransferase